MKQTHAKKRLVQLSTSLLFIFILSSIIYSCRKELRLNQPSTSADTVNAAKSWYQSNYPMDAGTIGNIQLAGISRAKKPLYNIITPDWDHAGSYTRFNKKVIEIPLDQTVKLGFTINKNGFSFDKNPSKSSFLILNDGKSYTAYIMTILADSAYLQNDYTKLARNSYRSRDANFSGFILYSSPAGDLINGWHYLNGKINQVVSASSSLPISGLQIQSTPPAKKVSDVSSCYFQEYSIYLGSACVSVGNYSSCDDYYADYSEEICDTQSIAPDDPSGGLSPGFPDPQGPTMPPPVIATITNDLTGCNGVVVNTLITKNLTGNVGNIISLFNTSGAINVHFVESTDTNGAPAATVVTSSPNSSTTNIEIRINTTVLPGDASEDYKASIILHEIIHGYLDSQGIDLNNQLAQHADIANGYVSGMASILTQAFGTDAENATALAFGGIGDFATAYPNQYNQLLQAQGITESTRSYDTEFQRAGINGTRCN